MVGVGCGNKELLQCPHPLLSIVTRDPARHKKWGEALDDFIPLNMPAIVVDTMSEGDHCMLRSFGCHPPGGRTLYGHLEGQPLKMKDKPMFTHHASTQVQQVPQVAQGHIGLSVEVIKKDVVRLV